MKKQIDTDRLTNELKGSSLFFYPKPAPAASAEDTTAAERREPFTSSTEPSSDSDEHNPNRSINAVTQQRTKPGNQEIGDGFDINAAREARGTFELTEQEYDAISEIKRPLGRQFGVRITLHDIVRCAINQALADYHANGEVSFLIRHLKRKKG